MVHILLNLSHTLTGTSTLTLDVPRRLLITLLASCIVFSEMVAAYYTSRRASAVWTKVLTGVPFTPVDIHSPEVKREEAYGVQPSWRGAIGYESPKSIVLQHDLVLMSIRTLIEVPSSQRTRLTT